MRRIILFLAPARLLEMVGILNDPLTGMQKYCLSLEKVWKRVLHFIKLEVWESSATFITGVWAGFAQIPRKANILGFKILGLIKA